MPVKYRSESENTLLSFTQFQRLNSRIIVAEPGNKLAEGRYKLAEWKITFAEANFIIAGARKYFAVRRFIPAVAINMFAGTRK